MIRLQGISRYFQVGDQAVHALDGVSLDIAAGQYVSIMGPSGSGKSTLLHILGLLDRPTSGRYFLNNRDTTDLDERSQAQARLEQIGFVFQFFHLVPRLTAFDNVALPLVLSGTPPEDRNDRVRQRLEVMGLADRMHHRPEQLSGGQRQRVAIARATIMNPPILLADEPTGNLDRASGKDVVDAIEALVKQGITLVVVTHDPDIGSRATRRIRMVDGRVAGDSMPRGSSP